MKFAWPFGEDLLNSILGDIEREHPCFNLHIYMWGDENIMESTSKQEAVLIHVYDVSHYEEY